MSLFQRPVLEKYLKQQDSVRIAKGYEAIKAHFHDTAIQANIRDSKEEQYQEGFLRDLFVNVLGYTLNPQDKYDLTTEFKNEKGSKKADGAILSDGKAIAVIELKGTDTTDLGTINTQAFNYKANQSQCVYVVTSNFEKLRFFIDNAVEWIEFDLFNLTEEQFRLLWLCLHRDSLFAGIPKKVKTESVQEEENITKKLYSDYSGFKTALWQDLVKQHPEHDQLLLFKKTQKLLDRFLFVLFSEDKG
nr:restriction endonuclease subunit M [Flavobacteriales bacterium]